MTQSGSRILFRAATAVAVELHSVHFNREEKLGINLSY